MAWKFTDLFSRRRPESAPPPPPPAPASQAADAATAEAAFQRGNAHASRQQWLPALDCYREATRIDPGHAAAHAFLGNVLRQLSQPDAALAAYDKAIAAKPDFAEAHYNRGAVLRQAGQALAALQSFEAATGLRPAFVEAHLSRAAVLRELGRLDQALLSYQAAIAAAPGHAGAHAERALTLMASGNLRDAIAGFDRAIELAPQAARIVSNRAEAQSQLGLVAEARASHDQAAALDPRDPEVQFNRGAFLVERREWSAAVESYRVALALRPDYAQAWCNLGLAQQETGQDAAALASYSRALDLDPTLAAAFNNRGNVFRSKLEFAPAAQDYRRALALQPDAADVHYNLGQLALLQGDLAAGWPEYEWRRRIPEALAVARRALPFPAWSGAEPLRGKRLFLHAEQGLGDTIQFCRYASLVAALGARVTLEVQPSLRDLCAALDGVAQLVVVDDDIPPADYECSLLSLPGAFKTTLTTIPGAAPYLRADPGRVARWLELLGPRTRPRVGLAWSGNPRHSNDANRSVALQRWLAYLPEGIEYVCLQNEIRDADRQALGSSGKIATVESHLKNFTDTAALIETLDLVVSVDTSLAHLAGALGKPTWILLPFLPDWRWLVERRDSPWYPSVTLYRQAAARDWDAVFRAVQSDLSAL